MKNNPLFKENINFAEIARDNTSKVAELKDWRVRSSHNKAMRDVAREIADTGYIIASPNELRERYGELYDDYEATAPSNDKRMVWMIHNVIVGSGFRKGLAELYFCPLCAPEEL